ncbi:MAG: PilZ domain-containing protein [Candidatus Zixiibacteriota bacterium]|nr:MAG: PilZ domain-containing protein [candidate division Zixibacteria bacterium]
MKNVDKVKFVSEIDIGDGKVEVRKPFKMDRDQQRRFIRLEISAPVWMKSVKDSLKNFTAEEDYHFHGTVLNISAGGVLVDLEETIHEKDIVLMRFILQDVEKLDNVLGVVKRVEKDGEGFLAGIEFINRENLKDMLSQAEIDLLSENVNGFEERVHEVLSRYLYRDEPNTYEE